MRLTRLADRLITGARPLVPEAAWPAVRTAMSLVGDGPVVGLPGLSRALVLAPHPDDESLGPGGTLARLADAGAAVTVVVLTDGTLTPRTGLSRAGIERRRREETRLACGLLGLGEPRFLGHPDGALSSRVAEAGGAIAAMVGELAPEAVFLPWFGDAHPDHVAASSALVRAGLPARVEVWAYETWAPLPANRVVDVTPTIARKTDAVAAHRTAHAAFDIQAMLGLNRYRSVHGLAGKGWAEAFLVAPADRYLDLVSTLDGRPFPTRS